MLWMCMCAYVSMWVCVCVCAGCSPGYKHQSSCTRHGRRHFTSDSSRTGPGWTCPGGLFSHSRYWWKQMKSLDMFLFFSKVLSKATSRRQGRRGSSLSCCWSSCCGLVALEPKGYALGQSTGGSYKHRATSPFSCSNAHRHSAHRSSYSSLPWQ